jgi:hypothetical protein
MMMEPGQCEVAARAGRWISTDSSALRVDVRVWGFVATSHKGGQGGVGKWGHQRQGATSAMGGWRVVVRAERGSVGEEAKEGEGCDRGRSGAAWRRRREEDDHGRGCAVPLLHEV